MFDPTDDVPLGERGMAELLDYVLDHISGANGDDEKDWVEIKSDLNLNSRVGGARAAKFILGASNRDPKKAMKHLGGHAVFIVGIGGGVVTGTSKYELRDIEPHIEKIVDGAIHWDVHWLRRNDLDVAVIVVGRPDGRVHAARRSAGEGTGAVVDGQIYVRAGDRTIAARADEIDRLLDSHVEGETRRPDFDVEVRLLGTPSASDMDVRVVSQVLRQWAAREFPTTSTVPGFGRGVTADDARRWADSVDENLGEIQRGAFSLMGVHMAVEVINRTQRDLDNVRVEISIPGHWWLLPVFDRDDFAAVVPDRPMESHFAVAHLAPNAFYQPPEIDAEQVGVRGARRLVVQFDRLVPEGSVISDRFVIALLEEDSLPEQIAVNSSVTARGVDTVLRSELVMQPRTLVLETRETANLIAGAA